MKTTILHRLALVLATSSLLLAGIGKLSADTYTFTLANGDNLSWTTRAHWTGGGGNFPNAAGDTAIINTTTSNGGLLVLTSGGANNIITLGKLVVGVNDSTTNLILRSGTADADGGWRFDNNGLGAELDIVGNRYLYYGANPSTTARYPTKLYLADNLTITAKDSMTSSNVAVFHANITASTAGLKTLTFTDDTNTMGRTSWGWYLLPAEATGGTNYSTINDGAGQVRVVASGARTGMDIATKYNTYTGGTEIKNGSRIAIAGLGSIGGENAGALTFGEGGGTLMWRSGIKPVSAAYTDAAHAYDVVVNGPGIIDLSNTNNGSYRYSHNMTGDISGSGELTFKNSQSAAATIIQLRGDNSGFTGNVVLDKARIAAFNDKAFGSGAGRVFTLKNNAELDFRTSMTFSPDIVLGAWSSGKSQILAYSSRVVIDGVISQTGGIQTFGFYGTGTNAEIVLNKANTYTATTELTNYITLTANNIDKIGSATGSGQINVTANSRLNVLGRVTGQANVAAGGAISGNGILGDIVFAAGATTLSATQGLTAGDVTVNGDLLIKLDLSSALSGSPIIAFDNLIKGGSSLSFEISGADNVSDYTLLSVSGSNGFLGESVTLTGASSAFYDLVITSNGFALQAIPEPGTYATILGILSLTLALTLRRRRK